MPIVKIFGNFIDLLTMQYSMLSKYTVFSMIKQFDLPPFGQHFGIVSAGRTILSAKFIALIVVPRDKYIYANYTVATLDVLMLCRHSMKSCD